MRNRNGSDSGSDSMATGGLARLRQGAYRLFSQSLLYPDEERLANLVSVAGELRREDSPWAEFAFFPLWSQFLDSLKGLRHLKSSAAQTEYVSSFMVNSAGVPCPIYESAYLGDDPSAVGWLLVQLEREYSEVGLSVSPTLQEAPDHAAVELEFMSFLCSREAESWKRKSLSEALQECRRQLTFLRRHLTVWFPEFTREVVTLNSNSVFATVSQAAQAFLVHDAGLVDALLQRFESVTEVP